MTDADAVIRPLMSAGFADVRVTADAAAALPSRADLLQDGV